MYKILKKGYPAWYQNLCNNFNYEIHVQKVILSHTYSPDLLVLLYIPSTPSDYFCLWWSPEADPNVARMIPECEA